MRVCAALCVCCLGNRGLIACQPRIHALRSMQVDIVNEGMVTADGRPCTLQLPEGLALESDSVDLDDVECVPTMSDDGSASALPMQVNAISAGARYASWG